ncbi:MAG TPA: hypothetical protein DEB06_04370 [Phycisphaerales bacterium]|nr:hypothetical protein [Phycisphaerales bacterium]
MIERIRTLRRNTGLLGIVQGTAALLFFGSASILALAYGEWTAPVLLIPLVVGVLWFARELLYERSEWIVGGLRVGLPFILLFAIFSKQITPHLPFGAIYGFFAICGLYLGCWFWVYSDPRIRLVQKSSLADRS